MRISSITVAFNPDPLRLARQIIALRTQVDKIFLVDNASIPSVQNILRQPDISALLDETRNVVVITIHENVGVATAFNVGIANAQKLGAEFVLLLDHDSVPAADMVSNLVYGLEHADINDEPIAIVGPRIIDSRDAREYPFIRFGWLRNQHLRGIPGQTPPIACDFLISSGSLVSIDAFNKIGKFDDQLFIDNVDVEWCCRAGAQGFLLYGICAATLDHQLGDHRRMIWNRTYLIVHSPLRMYYQTRNRIMLYRRSYIPLKWSLKDLLRMVARFVATIVFVAPRGQYLRMTMLAIRDGFANRGGRF